MESLRLHDGNRPGAGILVLGFSHAPPRVALFNRLLKMMKYGVDAELPEGVFGAADVKRELLRRRPQVDSILSQYPSYFRVVFENFGR